MPADSLLSRSVSRPLGEATLTLNAGLAHDPLTRAIAPNIAMSVNNAFTPGEGGFSADGVADLTSLPFLYAGWTNPTVRQLELRIAALEHTDDALATASGTAAAAAVFFSLLKAGDHLILSDVCYAGIHELARKMLPDFGVEVSTVNLSRMDDVVAAIRPNTRLIHAESPCNPLLRLTDLTALGAITRARGILLAVDSTFATPVATCPIDLGADLVIHSLTKFMNGHGDAMGGCVAGPKALVERIRSRAGVYLGATLSAQNAWLIMRGLDTLVVRMRAMSASAHTVATYLQAHPAVSGVIYPGLESHPQHALACAQMRLAGALITFQVRNPDAVAMRLAQASSTFDYAFSIGHQRSLAVFLKTQDLLNSSFELSPEQLADYRRYAGDGVFRLSIGLEDPQDLIHDLEQALSA
ncbi:cystathionine gamma-synthase [Hydrogenophaga crassostreae]|uniref:Cystathionine gamma-synthase n=1 Tax=Hydrogenophaga crassostreae TaxID=1763535 RepID=A0A167GE93_9BURK|nr:aminotransferase class I/II-fold pyridoxal phosphate-dependent enzyme [Hydrogenophaga crassostreae]AOW11493.1 cystathionine gamma-synthase [Hydrogenophaga crassostreae]OAD39333.1 cystathionine gamma-synthase [Hydrogenophaga crassostreae]